MNLLHNMSVPPRTAARLGGSPITSGIVVYSLAYAVFRDPELVPYPPNGPRFFYDVLNGTPDSFAHLCRHFPTPEDLFQRIGPPSYPHLRHHFLLGWHPSSAHIGRDCRRPEGLAPDAAWSAPTFCLDPRRCAGVLSRCYGTVLLAHRPPDLSWDRLLARGLAFDEALFPAA